MDHSFLTRPVFHDAELAALMDDRALTRAMLRFEGALALAQAELGIVPQDAASRIAATAETLTIPVAQLETGMLKTGVPVPALVAELRAALDPDAADWVHYGATSQDVVDTATCLCFAQACVVLSERLTRVLDALTAAARAHAQTPMLARTRGQLATPVSAGQRFAQWAQPLIALEADLDRVVTHALRVQFGGASGSRSVVAPHGRALSAALAEQLSLSDATPWHTDRSGLGQLRQWLSNVLSALGKMAGDLVIGGRGEIAEIAAGAGGGSSTMPQKSNPVGAEAILSLVQVGQALASGLTFSEVHAEERDGAKWTVEWLLLPNLISAAGAALARAEGLTADLRPNPDRMLKRITDHPEVMAEAAVFALAQKVGRVEAARVVSGIVKAGLPLLPGLQDKAPQVDWAQELDPVALTAPAADVVDQILATRKPR